MGSTTSAPVGDKPDMSAGTKSALLPPFPLHVDKAWTQEGVRREDVTLPAGGRGLAFVLHGVLTPVECEYLIDVTEASGGYTPALVNTGAGEALMPDVRNSTRIMVDHEALGALLFERVQPHVPREWTCEWTCRTWTVEGVNERMRFLRYHPGQEFKPHLDSHFKRMAGPKAGDCSFITLQLYLNQGYGGGSTRFLGGDGRVDVGGVDVYGQVGMVLVFQHDLLHQGSLVTSGVKYAMRTDLMFSRRKGVAAAPSVAGAEAGAGLRGPDDPSPAGSEASGEGDPEVTDWLKQ